METVEKINPENKPENQENSQDGWFLKQPASKRLALACFLLWVAFVIVALAIPTNIKESRVQLESILKETPVSTSRAPMDWSEAYRKAAPSVVQIVTDDGRGSGVVFDKGYVVTNYHVASGCFENYYCWVTSETGIWVKAWVKGTDSYNDLVVLKLQYVPESLRVAKLGNSDDLKIGEPVAVLGYPLKDHLTLDAGVVRANNKKGLFLDGDGEESKTAKQHIGITAKSNAGDSGGALINQNGEVVGIHFAGNYDYRGDNSSIPINILKSEAESLKLNYSNPGVGIGVYVKMPENEYGHPDEGVEIRSINYGGPAYDTSLRVGQIITKVNGNPVSTLANYYASFNSLKAGDEVTLEVKDPVWHRTELVKVRVEAYD